MKRPDQLALPFVHAPDYAADAFMPADSNAAALAWLASDDWPQGRLAMWGPAGSGKTHLLHIWAARHRATLVQGPALDDAPPTGPVAIDQADAAPEVLLLHRLNAAAEAGFRVLLAARMPPGRWNTELPDLASRLRAATATEIVAADESLLRALLARLLADRQIAVPASVQDWLRMRLPRSAAAMRQAALLLDHLALTEGGRVTRLTAARVLTAMTQPEDASDDEDFAQSA